LFHSPGFFAIPFGAPTRPYKAPALRSGLPLIV
jgi:hypothetical protein